MDSEAVNVRLERAAIVELDNWRRDQADLPARPEAIRRLIKLGLQMRAEPSVKEDEPTESTSANWPDLAAAVQDIETGKR